MFAIRLAFALLVLASLAANLYFLLRDSGEQRRVVTQSAALDQFEVIRTKGGLLAVSTIKAPEFFQATADHQVLGVQVSRAEIKRVQLLLNDRPRKILDWHSPAHAFHHLLH